MVHNGNCSDFGDLTRNANSMTAVAGAARGVCLGGRDSPNDPVNVMDFITIQSLGNAVDFGDLTQEEDIQEELVHLLEVYVQEVLMLLHYIM